jgi:hypothetical protein
MEIILVLILLIIVWCVAFMVGNKQGATRTINQIKKDGGYFDMEITGAVYPYKTSSLNDDTMGSIGSKPKTQTDYRREHSKEFESAVRDVIITTLTEKHKKK